MAGVRRARGKKSVAIGDRSGFKVPYTSLKTTWDGLRVEPEDWEPKHPQLTPARNVVDATALFNPRPDNDPENAEVIIGFNFDPFIPITERPPIGVRGSGFTGWTTIRIDKDDLSVTGVAGTGAVGTVSLIITLDAPVTGVAGTGAIGTESIELNANPTSAIGTGTTGTPTPQSQVNETGVAGTGATGAEVIQVSPVVTGVAGTGSIHILGTSNGSDIAVTVSAITGIGSAGAVGNEVIETAIIETGAAGTGAVGTVTIVHGWGDGGWGDGAWGYGS